MDILTRDTHATVGVTGFLVEADLARFHEDSRGMPVGCDTVKLALTPNDARALACALNLAALAAEAKVMGALQMSLFGEG